MLQSFPVNSGTMLYRTLTELQSTLEFTSPRPITASTNTLNDTAVEFKHNERHGEPSCDEGGMGKTARVAFHREREQTIV